MGYIGNQITTVFPTSISLDTVTASTSLKTPLVEFTDGDNAFTISDGGNVAFSGTVTGTSQNTPAFIASRTINDQIISANTWTKVQFNDEILDTDNMYDHSTNYRFTPTVAGKYYIYANIYSGTGNAVIYGSLHLNGNYLTIGVADSSQGGAVFLANIITFNGSSDYVEAYTYQGGNDGKIENAVQYAVWGGYKLIGV